MADNKKEGTTVRKAGTFRVEPGDQNKDPSLTCPGDAEAQEPGEESEKEGEGEEGKPKPPAAGGPSIAGAPGRGARKGQS